MSGGRVRIGLGAWNNRHFGHALYPLGTRHAEWLPRYARLLDCAEADVLYHRAPEPEELAGWAAAVPENFRFVPKMHKRVAQGPWDEEALAAARAFVQEMEALGDRRGPTLLQFPAAFEHDPDAADWLERLLRVVPRPVVEFRHESWFMDEHGVEALLRDRDAGLVWSTWPKAPAPPWRTARTGFVRFVGTLGKRRGRWVTQRDGTDELLRVREALLAAQADGAFDETYVVVTNRFEGNAVDSLPTVAAAVGRLDVAEGCRRPPGTPLLVAAVDS